MKLWVFLAAFAIATTTYARTISQLVIVYAPDEDWNGALDEFDEHLSPLIEAAQKRNLRVVLIDADHFGRGNRGRELLKNAIRGALNNRGEQSASSMLIFATHGGNTATTGGKVDTSLSFGGGINFSELSDGFKENPNVGGVMLQACHSQNDFLESISGKALTCATSLSDHLSNQSILDAETGALTAAIQLGKTTDFVGHMKAGVATKLLDLDSGAQETLTGPDRNFAKIPIFGPPAMEVEFTGKKFEMVDPFGNAVKPCYYAEQAHRIASFPSRKLPDAVTNSILSFKPTVLSHMTFDPQSPTHLGLTASCSDQGEMIVSGADEGSCNHSVELGDKCEASVRNLFKSASTTPPAPWPEPDAPKLAHDFCAAMTNAVATWQKRGVNVEAKRFCTENTCTFETKEGGFNYRVGTCTAAGNFCALTPMGSPQIIDSDDCESRVNALKKREEPCRDVTGKLAGDGECFDPAYPARPNHVSPGGFFPFPSGLNEMLLGLHGGGKFFRCEKAKAALDEKCCTSEGGIYTPGRPFSDSGLERGIAAQNLHLLRLFSDLQPQCHREALDLPPTGTH